MSVRSLACQESVFLRYHSEKHLSEFYPQDGEESQLASKLRHCQPMYRLIEVGPSVSLLSLFTLKCLRRFIKCLTSVHAGVAR